MCKTNLLFILKQNHNHKISAMLHLDTPSLTLRPPLPPFLALPSYPTFPSHPWGVLCATAETTDGAQHHPESERDGGTEQGKVAFIIYITWYWNINAKSNRVTLH